MERVEAEEEESGSMEILDSDQLLNFGTNSSSSTATATITCSNNSHSTAEEVTTDRRSNKRQRRSAGASASLGTIKVRKDKLGDRIAALQQLVSPFGKSDTASVLHEALGYIRSCTIKYRVEHSNESAHEFVVSSPYLLQRPPTAAAAAASLHREYSEGGEESRGRDLRSRGLCLVPIACTEEVANDKQNGADLWSPATNLCYNH